MKLMTLFIILLISIISYQQWQIIDLQENFQIIYNKQMLRDKRNKLEETDYIRTAKNSILVLKCSDRSSTVKNWLATAIKVHPTHVATVFHNIAKEINQNIQAYPISCNLFQEGKKMGSMKILSEKEMLKYQVGGRDIALVPVEFTNDGIELPNLVPTIEKISVGDLVSLIASPAKFHLDAPVSFGVILAKNIQYSLMDDFQTLWANAFSSDVFAGAGASGGAIIHLGGEKASFIGVHVGNNGKSGIYLAYYHLAFDQEFMSRYNQLN